MEGMTLKQYRKDLFLRMLAAYREAKQHLDTPEDKAAFIKLSVALHVAKGGVPERWWPMVNK